LGLVEIISVSAKIDIPLHTEFPKGFSMAKNLFGLAQNNF